MLTVGTAYPQGTECCRKSLTCKTVRFSVKETKLASTSGALSPRCLILDSSASKAFAARGFESVSSSVLPLIFGFCYIFVSHAFDHVCLLFCPNLPNIAHTFIFNFF